MTAVAIASWVLVFGSITGIIVAGAALAWSRSTRRVAPRWTVLALFGSVITGSLASIAAQVTV
ncbi:hypothetical protein HQ346_16915 [Rhodococcus sp. BP-252]|uniref:hypothetical protein n=1 Tax=unclassified Rhodococcus (in: high G+C Gram-positive bacteria) TaxID=192944 RepID=UPI001C9B1C89|nr:MULTISPECIES: hypothetical protein [unclassified Rhodococcus (in: high G+C Gram-positive bacteria)]MBY6413378.1 hypothetical protein [Rhodococcus sp. BP-320]MBY6418018.1 hypothetical protein [Rhodococcus sp. BP-321]MBY6422292.1 hypothetical protein [Rhodococcus sp. BP-324]MBY6428067.1 hypothetical protein [Rhodococcus sp. BP-323]MBY6433299.1 hypothetical protein [Rhodococcus sp. BP-322]